MANATPLKKTTMAEVLATLTSNAKPSDTLMADTLANVQAKLVKDRMTKGEAALMAVAEAYQETELALRRYRAEQVAVTEKAYKDRLTGLTALFEKIGKGDWEALDGYQVRMEQVVSSSPLPGKSIPIQSAESTYGFASSRPVMCYRESCPGRRL